MAVSESRSDKQAPFTAEGLTLRRLRVALVAAVIVPMLLLVVAAWDERTQSLHAAADDAAATVAALREHALKAIKTQEMLILEIDHRIQGMDRDQILSASDTLSAAFLAMRTGMPEVSAITVTDAAGWRIAGIGSSTRNGKISLANREYWWAQRDADQGTFISHAYVGMLSGHHDFGISRRRASADGRFNGTVHVSIRASYFSDFWSEVLKGRKGAAVGLLRNDGALLVQYPKSSDAGSDAIWQARGFAAEPQGKVFRATSLADGIERIYAYAPVGSYPLEIRYGVTVSAVLAPWRQHLLYLCGVAVLAAGALMLAVLAAMRQVRRLIEEQALRAAAENAAQNGQRLELLGQLAAGIAHDFANILQAMQVAATLFRRGANQPERVRSLADRLGEDVERGTSLIKRMLDLVRRDGAVADQRQGGAVGLMNPAEVMTRVADVLPRLLGSQYRLRCEARPEALPPLIRGDRSELEVVVMNLAVNARDAMPGGGEVVIRAEARSVTRAIGNNANDEHRPRELEPGLYVRISVTDSGVGMSPEVLDRAGELFFTTKPRGRGTGLGLAGARAFAERAGGKLSIESRPGRGTTIALWLPAFTKPPTAEVELVSSRGEPRNAERSRFGA